MRELSNSQIEELIKRVEGESDAGYDAFCRYAMLPEKERPFKISMPLLAEQTNLSESTLKYYAVHFKWNERLSQITAFLLMLNIKEQQKQTRELNQEFLHTNREIKVEMMKNLQKTSKLLSNVLSWAAVANEEKVVGTVIDAEGNEVPVKTEVKMAFKVTDIASIVTAMKRGVELVNEIPTEIINNKPVSTSNISEVTDLSKLDEIDAEIDSELQQFENVQ